jgi:hypothetical protein
VLALAAAGRVDEAITLLRALVETGDGCAADRLAEMLELSSRELRPI